MSLMSRNPVSDSLVEDPATDAKSAQVALDVLKLITLKRCLFGVFHVAILKVGIAENMNTSMKNCIWP